MVDRLTLPSESEVRDWFRTNHDVLFVSVALGEEASRHSLLLFYCEGLCDDKQINQIVLPALQALYREQTPCDSAELEERKPLNMRLIDVQDLKNELIQTVFDGNLLLYFQELQAIFAVPIAKRPQRAPEEPNTEISVRGARDGFVEELAVNVALVRKRLKTTSFSYEQLLIGTRSKTKVALLYVDDIAKPDMIEQVRSCLKKIDVDAIHNTSQLEEALSKTQLTIFPVFSYTGRPDFVSMALGNGRFALLVDGASSAIVGPVNLFFLLEGTSDASTIYFFTGFERLVRVVGLLIALLLPSFWIALNGYHQDQIPLSMLATVVISRQGVPMSAPIEAFLMIMLFELFREAGMRLPTMVGQTLSVVGGLIIGQAAISAGLTSPSMLVVIATSAVASFILGNQDLSGSVRILN
ncbi:MAG: spore germination protein, partial [Tumebacillaceae bacterium]